jgi:general secretion pathway protein G
MSLMSLRHKATSEAGFTLVEMMIVLVMISVIASISIEASFHAFDASRLGRTVANMRGTSDAILKYQTDTSSLPGGGLQPVSAIAATIRPSGGNIATTDGWDHPIYYEPTVTAQGLPTFRLYSYGKDGASDGVVTGTWVDFFSDTVMEGGSFIQTRW